MHYIKHYLTVLLILAGGIAPRCFGSIILFDNMAFDNGGKLSIATYTPVGSSFSTGSQAMTLDNLTVALDIVAPPTGTSTFSLYSDNSSHPGTLITNLGTIDDTSLTSVVAPYIFSDLSVGLEPSTRYWIMATTTGNARWCSAPDGSGTGLTGEFIVAQGIVVSDIFGPMNMAVTASVVPEPGSFSLLGGGLALAFTWRARRRRSDSA